MRIISTANVPPQQHDWWLESVFGSSNEDRGAAISKLPAELVSLLREKGLVGNEGPVHSGGRLPNELMDIVRKHFEANADALPMTLEEAKEHRKKLMEERSGFVRDSNSSWHEHYYNFCEH